MNLMSDEHYLPGLSEKTKSLNKILEGIYGFEIREFDEVPDNLNRIAQELQQTQDNITQLSSYDYNTDTTNQIRKQVNNYSLQFNSHLTALVQNKESELEKILDSMDDAKNNITVLTSLRQKANSIEDYINSTQGISETLDIRHIDCPELFSDYSEKREQIHEIDEEISLLNERYSSFFNSSNAKIELKSLLKATKTKGLFKTEVYKRCKQSRYYAGIIKLDNLHQNIKLLLSNKTEYNVFVSYQKNREIKTTKESSPYRGDTEYQKVQIPEKTLIETTIQTKSKSFSHLHALIKSVGYPKDYSYFKLRDTLNGKYSSNWSERLSQFSSELDKVELTNSGRQYLSHINQCLEIALGQGQYLDEINSARNSIDMKLAA